MDPALVTARELVAGMVCECGHVESEHYTHDSRECTECTCEIFEPVTFEVRRVELSDPDVDEEHARRQADILEGSWRNS
jgi:hypothetical protein